MIDYVVTYYVPERHEHLITPGKRYEVLEWSASGRGCYVKLDPGKLAFLHLQECAFLDHQAWRVGRCTSIA